jgi:hypothetical protein
MKILLLGLLCLTVVSGHAAIIGLGGYVPNPGTQKSADGGKNTLSPDPFLSIGTKFPLYGPTWAMPELGYVVHGGEKDNYSKKTIFILWDVGYNIAPKLLFRFGLGTFLTKISGDKEAVSRGNGASGSATFYTAGESVTSYNTTSNLGIEYGLAGGNSIKLETYVFSLFGDGRHVNYSLSMNFAI